MSSLTCVATEVITTHQTPVGYAYREKPVSDTDSGWRFLSGSETEQYMDRPSHYVTCTLADFIKDHPEVEPLLASPVGAAFARRKAGEAFQALEEE